MQKWTVRTRFWKTGRKLDDVDDVDEQETIEFQPFKLNLDNLGQNTYGDAGNIATDILAGKNELLDPDIVDEDQDTPPSSIITNPGRRRSNRNEDST